MEEADRLISDFGFELIARGQYSLASNVLSFGSGLRDLSSERRRRIMIVNLANAERLLGDEKKALEILNKEDWSISDPLFELCVAAVRRNVDEVVNVMRKIGKDAAQPTAEEYQSWPVFFHVRDDKRFSDAFKEIFGFDYVASSKRQAGLRQIYDLLEQEKGGEGIEIRGKIPH